MVAVGSPFDDHRAVLGSAGVLCGRLAPLMLPCLAATAIGLQLPEGRRPPRCTWQRAAIVAGAMDFVCATQGAEPFLAQSGCIPRLLQLAVQLVAHAPVWTHLATIVMLLGTASLLHEHLVLPQRALAPQQAAQLARQLLGTLPKFAQVLPVASAPAEPGPAVNLMVSLQEVADLLSAIGAASQPRPSASTMRRPGALAPRPRCACWRLWRPQAAVLLANRLAPMLQRLLLLPAQPCGTWPVWRSRSLSQHAPFLQRV